MPSLDFLAVVKAVWGALTFVMIGLIKITYNNYKNALDRLDRMDKDMIRMQAEMVTKEKLDEILDKKIKEIRDDVSELRKDIKEDVGSLRGDLQKQFEVLLRRHNA